MLTSRCRCRRRRLSVCEARPSASALPAPGGRVKLSEINPSQHPAPSERGWAESFRIGIFGSCPSCTCCPIDTHAWIRSELRQLSTHIRIHFPSRVWNYSSQTKHFCSSVLGVSEGVGTGFGFILYFIRTEFQIKICMKIWVLGQVFRFQRRSV